MVLGELIFLKRHESISHIGKDRQFKVKLLLTKWHNTAKWRPLGGEDICNILMWLITHTENM